MMTLWARLRFVKRANSIFEPLDFCNYCFQCFSSEDCARKSRDATQQVLGGRLRRNETGQSLRIFSRAGAKD
jgi:hypothetical protein